MDYMCVFLQVKIQVVHVKYVKMRILVGQTLGSKILVLVTWHSYDSYVCFGLQLGPMTHDPFLVGKSPSWNSLQKPSWFKSFNLVHLDFDTSLEASSSRVTHGYPPSKIRFHWFHGYLQILHCLSPRATHCVLTPRSISCPFSSAVTAKASASRTCDGVTWSV